MISLHWLDNNASIEFPPVELAMQEPDGLLAAGGDLCPERLVKAYEQGIFPWYSQESRFSGGPLTHDLCFIPSS